VVKRPSSPPRDVMAGLVDLPYAEAKRQLVANFDEAYTTELLGRAKGNMSEAARLAGLDRSNFRRLIKRQK
jgi:DNA-binding NtrC family response regulator